MRDIRSRFRPLGIADILDETFEIYKSKFVLLIGIAAVLYVPLLLFQAVLNLQPKALMGKGATEHDFAVFFVTAAALGVAYVVALALVTGALTYGISDSYLQRETTIGACYRRVLRPAVLWRFICANVLAVLAYIGAVFVPVILVAGGAALTAISAHGGVAAMVFGVLLIVVGVVAIIVPIHVMLRLVLVTPVFMVESPSASGALRRSWDLMKGNTGKALAVLIIASIAIGIVQNIILAPFTYEQIRSAVTNGDASQSTSLLATIVSTILTTLLMPVNSIIAILLYYDMRIRKEGFDLEILAQDLDQRAQRLGEQAGPALPTEQLPATESTEEERT